jgi:O-antigen ligase
MSDAGTGGLAGAFAVGGVLALLSMVRRRWYPFYAVVMAVGATTAVVTSQGRSAVIASVVVALGYGVLTATTRNRLAGLLGVAVAGMVAYFVIQAIVGAAGSSATFRYRGLNTAQIFQTSQQARGKSIAKIPSIVTGYPLGAGLGTAGPASGSPGASALTVNGALDAENEISFMTLETGIAGAALIVAFTVYLFGLGLRRCRNETDREVRALLAAIIAPLGAMAVLYLGAALTPTTPGGPYLWAVAGIVSYWLFTRPAQMRAAEADRVRLPAPAIRPRAAVRPPKPLVLS